MPSLLQLVTTFHHALRETSPSTVIPSPPTEHVHSVPPFRARLQEWIILHDAKKIVHRAHIDDILRLVGPRVPEKACVGYFTPFKPQTDSIKTPLDYPRQLSRQSVAEKFQYRYPAPVLELEHPRKDVLVCGRRLGQM